jgi:hypothetical protein|eukprot:COSAG01_NODE_2818_length_7016_cov_2.717363_7_plen_384_part_00
MNELGMMEDIVLAGAAQQNLAKTAILYSESADIWLSPIGTPGAAKRSLYLALRHAQIPVDIVNEEDCGRGSLNHYAALFIVDEQVSETAVTSIGQWVSIGGHVFVTAGGAQLNEANQTNAAMQKLSGITQHGIWTGTRYSRHNSSIYFVKEELPFAETLDVATVLATETSPPATLGVFGAKSIFEWKPPRAAVRGKDYNLTSLFSNGAPASIATAIGKGVLSYAAFHPGLSYMQPAMPRRPVDRSPDLDSYTHFVPTEFNTGARSFLAEAVAAAGGAGNTPRCSEPLVEVGYVTSSVGTVLPLVNWNTPFNQTSFWKRDNYTRVVISLEGIVPLPTFKTASLASCGTLTPTLCADKQGNVVRLNSSGLTFSVDVAIADAIILR